MPVSRIVNKLPLGANKSVHVCDCVWVCGAYWHPIQHAFDTQIRIKCVMKGIEEEQALR